MKNVLLAIAAVLTFCGMSSVAYAQFIDFADSYVELDTNFDGNNEFTAGSAITVAGVASTFGEFTVDNHSLGNDFSVGLGQRFDLGPVEFDATAEYTWGASGGDIVGWGTNNVWGDTTVSGQATVAPESLGGAYAFASVDVDIEGPLDWDWTGGDLGVGYQLDFTERTYLKGEVAWGYDPDFEFTDRELNVGVGFRF